jgi:hypothetical protein
VEAADRLRFVNRKERELQWTPKGDAVRNQRLAKNPIPQSGKSGKGFGSEYLYDEQATSKQSGIHLSYSFQLYYNT